MFTKGELPAVEGRRVWCAHPEHGQSDACPGCGATFGKTWWVKYYVNGKPVRESTETDSETKARRMLKEREGRVAGGQPLLPRVDRIRYEEAAADLRQHYRVTGERNLEEAEYRLARLDAFFAHRRLASIGPADATAYAAQRQGEQVANGTINRELAVLSRMLRLAYDNNKLLRLPRLRHLEEAAPRSGFFEREQYEAVRQHLPEDLQAAVAIAHTFGWRMQSEVLILELRQVDLEAGTIRLDPGATKNDEGRVVYLTPELRGMLTAQVARVMDLMRERGAVIPYLFPHLTGRHQGQRRREFRKAWKTACKRAGCLGMLQHDFRRTAVRNMVNAGIPERVAMAVTGHKTRSIFDRYHIVSPGDLQEASRRLAETSTPTVASRLDRERRSM
jgi:integrase